MHRITLPLALLVGVLAYAGAPSSDFDGDGVEDSEPDRCILVGDPFQLSTDVPVTAGDACDGSRLVVVRPELTDDGDGDGFADTRETVEMRLVVRNRTEAPLTDVTARITSRSPHVCISEATVDVGTIPAGMFTIPIPFRFHVGDVERSTVAEMLTVEFFVVFETAEHGMIGPQSPVTIDLDLDVTGGSGENTYVESFEEGLGTFSVMNLDAGIPGQNNAEGLANGDGWRCSYNDPDWVNTATSANAALSCFPGLDLAHADAVYWQVDGASNPDSPDGGRAFHGASSLYFGEYLTGAITGFTTPSHHVEAAGTTEPIAVGLASPTLSFRHQVTLADHRVVAPALLRQTIDRGIVQLQPADDFGDPAGPWTTIEAHRNPYGEQSIAGYFQCSYDPVDDGSTEDDFYNDDDPDRRYGPSSSCYPRFSYAYQGDVVVTDPDAVGYGDPGSGEAGELGIGTWVEAVFDLHRWRGRKVRLRFLTTGHQTTHPTWEEQFELNPSPVDDGWWIDDVTVHPTLDVPASIVVDTKDNSMLPGFPPGDLDGDGLPDACDACPSVASADLRDGDWDGIGNACDACPYDPTNLDPDGDGVCTHPQDNCADVPNPDQLDEDGDAMGAACDCDDGDASVFPSAPEINDGQDNQCPGDVGYGAIDEIEPTIGFHEADDPDRLVWSLQPAATQYQAVRSEGSRFDVPCATFATTGSGWLDPSVPDEDEAYFYLVRARAPNVGSFGLRSDGTEREVCE